MDQDSMDGAVVRGLRANGIDVLTTREAGRLGRSDADQLVFATSLGRVVYTANVGDFRRLQAAGVEHAGIIARPNQRMPQEHQIRALLNILNGMDGDGMRNAVEFISDWL
jgi:Domain of unknown function (DUF5615)